LQVLLLVKINFTDLPEWRAQRVVSKG